MKANELMIGDWVYDTILKCNTQVEMLSLSGIRGDCNENIWNEKTFEPIPLTAEILEKNGFNGHNPYQYVYKDNYCKVCVSFAPRIEIDGMDLGEPPINVSIEGALFDINMSMSAIHELQHALRLCGIDKEIVL